jgi:ketosteroid isomerase-like protein
VYAGEVIAMTQDHNRDAVHSLWRAFDALDFEAAAGLLHPDFVCEWPQSRERIRGVRNYIEVNRNYPGNWRITVDRLVAEGDLVASEVTIVLTQDGVQREDRAVSFFQLRDGLIVHETDYWPDPYLAPPGRAQWVEPLT